MSPLLKNLLFALALSVIAWLGYMVFIRQSTDELVTSDNGLTSSEAIREGQNFLVQLHQLQQVGLTGAVFQDAEFRSLIDLRTAVTPEPVGKANPFLPLPGHASSKSK